MLRYKVIVYDEDTSSSYIETPEDEKMFRAFMNSFDCVNEDLIRLEKNAPKTIDKKATLICNSTDFKIIRVETKKVSKGFLNNEDLFENVYEKFLVMVNDEIKVTFEENYDFVVDELIMNEL